MMFPNNKDKFIKGSHSGPESNADFRVADFNEALGGDPRAQRALEETLNLLKPAHEVIKALADGDTTRSKDALEALTAAVMAVTGPNADEAQVSALISITIAAGMQISPKSYGGSLD